MPSAISFRGVTFTVPDLSAKGKNGDDKAKKNILSDVSVNIERGQVVALMGPSGAGKTTLCDLVMGRAKVPRGGSLRGSVRVLGSEVIHDSKSKREGGDRGDRGDRGEVRVGASGRKNEGKKGLKGPGRVGYVHQDDLLLATFSPRETLRFSARLRLGEMAAEDREAIIDDLLGDLGLADAADTRVGDPAEGIKGISGGERKRTAIGVELITMPDVLVLDEPTSGLDAKTALEVITLLKRFAVQENKTILCSIHQPRTSIFELFDSLILLNKGRVLYHGPAMDIISTLEDRDVHLPPATNAADFLLDEIADIDDALTSGGRSRGVVIEADGSGSGYDDRSYDSYASSSSSYGSPGSSSSSSSYYEDDGGGGGGGSGSLELGIRPGGKGAKGGGRSGEHWTRIAQRSSRGKRRPLWYQILVIAQRSWLAQLRHPMNFAMSASTFFFLGIFTGLVYPRKLDDTDERRIADILGGLFFVAANAGFTTPFSVAATFPRERALFTRENASRYYGTFPYWLSTTLTVFPFQVLYTLLLGVTTYWITGLSADVEKFVTFLVVLLATIDCSTSIGLVAGSISRTVNVANSILTALILPWFTFGGLFVRDDAVPDYFIWLRYSSPFRYSFESLAINELRGRTFECVEPPCGALTGEEALSDITFSEDMLWPNVAIIFAISMALRILTYFFLLLSRK